MFLYDMLKEKYRVQEKLAEAGHYDVRIMLQEAVKTTKRISEQRNVTIHYVENEVLSFNGGNQ